MTKLPQQTTRFRLILSSLLVSFTLLSGCGNKGELYLPESDSLEKNTPLTQSTTPNPTK